MTDRLRLAFVALIITCLTALCLGNQIPPSVILGFLAGLPVPALDMLRGVQRRRDAQPLQEEPRELPLISLPVPPAELPLSEEQRIDAGWVLPEPDEPTRPGPPPLVCRPGAELRGVAAAAVKGPPESRKLNKERLVAEVQALTGVGLLAAVCLSGCASAAAAPAGLAVAVGWGGALLTLVLLRHLDTWLRPGPARSLAGALLAVVSLCGLSACSPAQRAAGDRYGAAVLACGAREAPAALQHGVSLALHAAAGADWRADLIGLGTRFGGCLLDAEVLRYALAQPGPQVRSQALALRQPGELGAGAAPAPDLSELARQRAVEWTTAARP